MRWQTKKKKKAPRKGARTRLWRVLVVLVWKLLRSWLYPWQLCSQPAQHLREEWLNLICTERMEELLEAGLWGDGNSNCSGGHQLACPLHVQDAPGHLNLSMNQLTSFCSEVLTPEYGTRESTFGRASDLPRWHGDHSPGSSGTVHWETTLWPHVTGVLPAHIAWLSF